MGLTHVTVALKSFGVSNGAYEADFLVDTGATDSLAPESELRKAGIQPVGRTAYELANGGLRNIRSDSLKYLSWERLRPGGSSLVRMMQNRFWE